MEKERDAKLLTLGNLTIITQSLNASIRDSDWNTKKEGKNNKPGLSMCANGIFIFSDTLNKSSWNEVEIAERAKWLLKKAICLWDI